MVEDQQVNGKIPDRLFGQRGEMSEEGELTPVRALPETGIEGSVGVHQAAKADTAPTQAQRQEIAQHGGGLFFFSYFIGPVINKDSYLY